MPWMDKMFSETAALPNTDLSTLLWPSTNRATPHSWSQFTNGFCAEGLIWASAGKHHARQNPVPTADSPAGELVELHLTTQFFRQIEGESSSCMLQLVIKMTSQPLWCSPTLLLFNPACLSISDGKCKKFGLGWGLLCFSKAQSLVLVPSHSHWQLARQLSHTHIARLHVTMCKELEFPPKQNLSLTHTLTDWCFPSHQEQDASNIWKGETALTGS